MHVPVHIPIRLYLQYLINKLYMYWMYNHYKMSDYAIMVLDLTLPLDKEPLKRGCEKRLVPKKRKTKSL